MFKSISTFSKLLISSGFALVFYSCANIVPPTGGLRDSTPPQILSSDIKDSSLHFNRKKITIRFDEPIEVANPKDAFSITPFTPKPVEMKVNFRSVDLIFPDSALEPNTTYVLSFNGVKDMTEGNTSTSSRFTFSTGAYLDSLMIGGDVISSETGLADTSVYVLLYQKMDSLQEVKTRKPKYAVKTNEFGQFQFRGIPAGRYHMFALGDKNKNFIYDVGTERFAFDTATYTVNLNSGKLQPFLFSFVKVNTSGSLEQTVEGKMDGKKGFNAGSTLKNTISFSIDTSLKTASQDLYKPLIMTLPYKLVHKDSSMMSLYDTVSHAVVPFTLTVDSSMMTLSLMPKLWESNHVYRLFMKDSALVYGAYANDRQAMLFKTMDRKNYSSLKLRFTPLDSSYQYVIELKLGNTLVRKELWTKEHSDFFINNISEGDYTVSYYWDKNRNGKRDNGDFEKLLQPEIQQFHPEPLKIKKSWDHVYDIKATAPNVKVAPTKTLPTKL